MVQTATEFPKKDTGSVWWRKDADKGCYRIFYDLEQAAITATSSLSTATYSVEMDHHIIRNAGTSTCYIGFDEAATTSGYEIYAGDYLIIDTNMTNISGICDFNEGTRLRIIGQV